MGNTDPVHGARSATRRTLDGGVVLLLPAGDVHVPHRRGPRHPPRTAGGGVAAGAVGTTRRLAGEWSGVEIAAPYRPEPPPAPGLRGWWQRTCAVLADPATWRDLLWALVNPVIGIVLTLLPFLLVLFGVMGLAMPKVWEALNSIGGNNWYWWIRVTDAQSAWHAVALGVPTLIVGVACAPWALRTHASLARTMLAPTRASLRVRHLTDTRAEAVNSSAAELRRIERDLHDGAQARLVALGLNLGVAEQLLAKDPEAVATILADTRKASATALEEMRALIRGIHPPVLADRGLVDAVRALAMDSTLRVTVKADVPGRPEAPVESAMYFAVAEGLTNATKHADARHVQVDLWYEGGRLRARVGDDGRGGADVSRGSGLRGIERRLAAFDGVLALTSPVGGPTSLAMEIPCALS
ncbi:sensor domain-containing protein [Streptomyces sp. NPDC059740]|uniref:sensor histidine kinase n=1 Tax=Streptomyces sp. NPDC059740 TaxID=3346926 RepID=UPI00364B91B1